MSKIKQNYSVLSSCLIAAVLCFIGMPNLLNQGADPSIPTISQSSNRVSMELALLVDVSGSVSHSEFDTQRRGYADAFRSQEVRDVVVQAGQIAVALVYWSGFGEQELTIPFTLVTPATIDSFAQEIESAPRPFSGGTIIPEAIDFAYPLFATNGFESDLQVMDISGDGASFRTETQEARDRALAAGVDVINGLPIGGPSLVQYYRDNVIGGTDPFNQPAANFSEFLDAAILKITREISIADQCLQDPNKFLPGICGCGVSDSDSDGDSVPDCIDECPADVDKTEAGACGCGISDLDHDMNGTADCNEECGLDPTVVLKNGLTTTTESLAALGLDSARKLNRASAKNRKRRGLERDRSLERFVNSADVNIKKTVASIADHLQQMPEIFKPCPGPQVCSSVDNRAGKEELINSVTKLNRLVRRITTRLFFFQIVENPDGAKRKVVPKRLRKKARRAVTAKRKAIKAEVTALMQQIYQIPDTVLVCQ